MENLIGKIINERYRVEESLGSSGMADVYKVWDTQRSIHLAMKHLREDISKDPEFLSKFKLEIKPVEKLLHPNIVRFHGLEEAGGQVFMIMDFVDRITLRKAITASNGEPFTYPEIMEIMQPVCSALHYAHHMGIVHGDLKPVNIMIEKSGWVQVADFGVSRLAAGNAINAVDRATLMAYQSPEQMKGMIPTSQSDIYALGLVLYELLTGGKRPFPGGVAALPTTPGLKNQWDQVTNKPISPRHFNPGVSEHMEWVVLKCLENEQGKRFSDALDLMEALLNLPVEVARLDENKVKSNPSPTIPIFRSVTPATPVTDSKSENSPLLKSENQTDNSIPLQFGKKRKINVNLILAGVAVVLAIILFLFVRQFTAEEQENAPVPPTLLSQVVNEVKPTPVSETITKKTSVPTEVLVAPTDPIEPTQESAETTPIPTLTPFQQIQVSNQNGAGNGNNSGLATMWGEWIYYRNDSDGGKIYRINQDGSKKQQMNNDNSYNIVISGNWIIYRNDSAAGRIYRMPLEGGTTEKVNDEYSGYISPAGDWIYYQNHTSGDMIYRVRMDGSGREKLTDNQSSFINVYKDKVYFVNDSDGHKIYQMQLDGSEKKKVTDDFSSQLLVVDDRIYYITRNLVFDASNNSSSIESTAITRIQLDGTGKETITKTKAGSINGYINVLGDWIFYIPEISYFQDKTGNNINIGGLMYRMQMGVNKRETVNNFGSNAINIVGDWIYYRKDGLGGKIYRMHLDGSGKESVS